jgi:hypothetical protein
MRIAAVIVLMGMTAVPLAAQGRDRSQGIPPGHLPPPGECRVWYDGRPPGQQPPPTSCRDAERIASRSRDARVIYGGDRDVRGDERWERDDRNRYPRRDRDVERYPDRNPNAGGRDYDRVPFDNGYRDGLEKGIEDARNNRGHDPVRHSRYRSADRGYNRQYGTKDEYKDVYRDGFRAGYDEGYDGREGRRGGVIRRPGSF